MHPVQYFNAPVGDLRPNPFNSNRVTSDNEKKIRESIRRNGIFKPIIVRQVASVSGYEIIGGQHRWEQAVALGFTEVPVANLGEITDVRAKEIGILDNARYGADDTLSLSSILKEIGDVEEIQSFLPYGDTDLSALFSAASIDLDDLELPETKLTAEEPEIEEPAAAKPAKTHTLMRFKASLGDAERLTALIAKTQKEQGFTQSDDLTNAGDAIVYLLTTSGHLNTTNSAAAQPENWDHMLDEIEAARQEQDHE
jgi:ParB-like chromosome segregation protein Spo0J